MFHLHVSAHFIHFPSTLNEQVQVRFIVAGCLDDEVLITKALQSVLTIPVMPHCIYTHYVLYLVYDIVNETVTNPISFCVSSNGRETFNQLGLTVSVF